MSGGAPRAPARAPLAPIDPPPDPNDDRPPLITRPGEPPNRYTRDQDIIQYQDTALYMYDWRRGRPRPLMEPFALREARVRSFKLPRTSRLGFNSWAAFADCDPDPYNPYREQNPKTGQVPRFRGISDENSVGGNRDQIINVQIPQSLSHPALAPLKVEFIKLLGFGGLGFASLFEVIPDQPGERPRRVVLKMAFERSSGRTFDQSNEWRAMYQMAGAQHIIQRLPIRAPKNLLQLPIGSVQQARAEADRRKKDMIWMEFMPRGRLADYLARYAHDTEEETRLDPLVYYMIFECIASGLIAMAHPGAYHMPGIDAAEEEMPLWNERIVKSGNPAFPKYDENIPLVHFDLDAQNMLVGLFENEGNGPEHGHDVIPIIKFSDLGLAKNMHKCMRAQLGPKDYWNKRVSGKPHLYTPEQFIDEWDYLDVTTRNGAHPHWNDCKIAGCYDWTTNTYQAGLIMFQWLTKYYPERKPTPSVWPLTTFAPNPAQTQNMWTYGGAIQNLARYFPDWDGLNPSFASLNTRLMCAYPKERPNRDELWVWMRSIRRLMEGDPNQVYAARNQAETLFGGTPPDPVKKKNPLDDPDATELASMMDIYVDSLREEGPRGEEPREEEEEPRVQRMAGVESDTMERYLEPGRGRRPRTIIGFERW